MSSYHSKFTYLNRDSKTDLGWIIVHFEGDSGETDSFLTQEQIFADSYNGSKRIVYGTKWTEVARPKITVIKQDGSSFSLAECREAYRWLTGNPNASWLKLYVGDVNVYNFLCTVQDVKPQKLDARTTGMNIYFESVSPWAYSPVQEAYCRIDQGASVDGGVLYSTDESMALNVNANGVLYHTKTTDGKFNILNDGTIDFNDITTTLIIDNETDDLYSYVYPDVKIVNYAGDYISIINRKLGEETFITGLSNKEEITITSSQFISSSKLNKIFGNTFNFVWPRLAPGANEFVIDCPGIVDLYFTYRYPIKAGDCAIDIDVSGNDLCCGNDSSGSDSINTTAIPWDNVTNKPTTIKGYGITDAYNMAEVDNKIGNITVNEQELNDMLASTLNK